jgi:hypothetical protein
VIIAVSAALAVVFSIGFALNREADKTLSMPGVNLSDLQPDAIIRHIVPVTGAKDDHIYCAR